MASSDLFYNKIALTLELEMDTRRVKMEAERWVQRLFQ